MLALIPLGGSFVILIPFYKIWTGKSGQGYEVKNSLNAWWMLLSFYQS